MNTKYEEIVNVNAIGKAENPISLNEILKKANDEQLTPSKQNRERVLFLGIDVQQDFMDNGALGVPGAHKDVERMTRFIYDNIMKTGTILRRIRLLHLPIWTLENGGQSSIRLRPENMLSILKKMERKPFVYGLITAFRGLQDARLKISSLTWFISTALQKRPFRSVS